MRPIGGLQIALALVLIVAAGGNATACNWDDFIADLLATEEIADAPPDALSLFWLLANDSALASRVVDHATPAHRCHTSTLLRAVSSTEPEARRVVPEIHVVQDLGPLPGERPPTSAEVRIPGLELLRAVALDSSQARDVRLARDLDRARSAAARLTPSVVGGWVVLWEEWWNDRGEASVFYADPGEIPDPTAWIVALEAAPGDDGTRTLLHLLPEMLDQPLRRRLFYERLSPDTHSQLVGESIHLLRFYQSEFEAEGVASPDWDPESGRTVGYRAEDLRNVCLEILPRVTRRVASGVDEHANIVDWLGWWRRARFEARYYRDVNRVPSVARWITGLDRPVGQGGQEIASFLRELYVATGFRSLLLERMGPAQSPIVAELVEWLQKDQRRAVEDGFAPAYTRRPLRPTPNGATTMVGIPWVRVQALIRELLWIITAGEGPADLGIAELADGVWLDWWRAHRHEGRWYRDGSAPPGVTAPDLQLVPERARSRG